MNILSTPNMVTQLMDHVKDCTKAFYIANHNILVAKCTALSQGEGLRPQFPG